MYRILLASLVGFCLIQVSVTFVHFSNQNGLSLNGARSLATRPLGVASIDSAPAETTLKAKLPLKIAVAGGGVGGVFLGYCLQKQGFDVTIFEKTAKFSRFGGPIQLASNALSCVNAMSPELFEKIMTRFTFTGTRTCGIKDGIRNKWYSIFDAIRVLAEQNDLPYTGVIDRPDLQELLLGSMTDNTVKNNMPIKHYVNRDDGKVDIEFENGEIHKDYDVLVGADGIWSSVRTQMWNEPATKPGKCTYSGYTLFAAENIMEPDSDFFKEEGYFDAGYKVYIGPGKYFVTSDVGSGRIQWYAFLALPPGTKARTSNVDFLKDQFKGWSAEIHSCLDNTPDTIVEQRDLYDRRPSVFKSWSQGSVTMIGDAVHPMMPNLGQGGCQAIEDAYVLSKNLCEITDRSQIPDALQDYYRQRIVRSAIVQGLSRFSSDIIISAFSTPFEMGELLEDGKTEYLNFKSLMTANLKNFLPMIFYGQFGYLYSFTPSSFKKDKIVDLVKSSLARNKAEAGKVYESLKEGYVTYFTAKTMSFMRYNKQTHEVSKVADAAEMRAKAESGGK